MALTKAKGHILADDLALGGNPTTSTQSTGNNTTRLATTAFVQTELAALVDSSPSSLNTLNELAAALGDDASFSTTVTNSIATKLPLAGGTLTGHLNIADDIRIKFGAGSDMQMYHVNANQRNYISTTDLEISSDSFRLFNTAGTTGMMTASASAISLLQPTTITNSLTLQDDFSSGVAITLNRTESGLVDTNFHIGVTSSGSAANDRMWLGTATTNLTITDEGNVAIGSDNPDGYSGDGNNLVIGTTSGDNGLSIISGTSNSSSIYFGDVEETGSGSRRGQVVYNHSDDSMRIFAAATERLRILSTGNLQFQGTTSTFVSKGFTPHSNGYLYLRGGSAGLRLDDDSSINTIQIADGSSGYIKFETGDGTERMRITSTGNVGIGVTNPIYGQLQIGDFTDATEALTFATSGNGSSYINFYDANATEGVFIKTTGQSYGGSLIIGAKWDTEETEFTFVAVKSGVSSFAITNGGNFTNANNDLNIHATNDDLILTAEDDVFIQSGNGSSVKTITVTAGGVTTFPGDVRPTADNGYDLGSTAARWRNLYTGDLHLSNEGSQNDVDGTSGNWTIQEGEEHLFIINNKNGKKYKFALEEIE